MNTLRLALPFFCFFITLASSSATIVSTFDCNDEGWSVVDIATAYPVPTNRVGAVVLPDYLASGDKDSGGCIVFQDRAGYVFYFQAPLKFLGDQSAAYGNFLTYDQYVLTVSNTLSGFPDVVLLGSGAVLVYEGSYRPTNTWTPFSVPLIETNGWHTDTLTGPQPTQSQFQSVLSSLTGVFIRGEYSPVVGEEATGLDNVIMRADVPGLPSATWVTPPPESVVCGEQIPVCWSFSGAPTHMNVHWDPVNPTFITNVISGSTRDVSIATNVTQQILAAPTNNIDGSPILIPTTVLYAVHVQNGGGDNYSAVVPVTVNPAVLPAAAWTTPPPSSLTAGEAFTVSWSFSGNPVHVNVHWDPTDPIGFVDYLADSTAYFSPPVIGSTSAALKAPTINEDGTPIDSPTVVKYVVHVGNRAGQGYSSVIPVTVNPAPDPTVQWLSPPPPVLKAGQTFQASWQYTGAPTHVNVHWSPSNPEFGSFDDSVIGSTHCSSRVAPVNELSLTAPVLHTNGLPISTPTSVQYVVHLQDAAGTNVFSDRAEVLIVPPDICAQQPSGIEWIPSPNFSSRPQSQTIDTVVIHTTQGDFDSALATLTDDSVPESNRVSAHYIIKQNGDIVQLVSLTNRAWHATYYNARSIGIEMVGFAENPSTWNPQNLASLENLVAWLVSQYPTIPIQYPPGDATDSTNTPCRYDQAGLVGHSQVQPDPCTTFAVKTDPGTNFPWSAFVANVQTKAACVPPHGLLTITGPQGNDVILTWPTNMVDHILETADQLSSGECWQTVWPPPTPSGRLYVTNPVTTQTKFYRLRKTPYSLPAACLLGEWESTIPQNAYRMIISWNAVEARFEGHLTLNGVMSADIGFTVGELVWYGRPTANQTQLVEMQKWRTGSGGVSTGFYWRTGSVNVESCPDGQFITSHNTYVRIN